MIKERLLILFALLCFIPKTFLGQGKISGYMFGDYFYNAARDAGIASLSNAAAGGEKSDQAFLFRRIYFTYDNDISEKFTSRFRLEAGNSTLASDGKFSVFVKDAYLRWKNIFQGSDFFFGIHPTPAFEISEKVWGYRSLEKTIMDLRNVVSSRDFGLALNGKFDKEGIFNYWIMVANGRDNKPELDKHKRYYLTFYVKPTKKLSLSLYGDYADRGKTVDKYSASTPKATVINGTFTAVVVFPTPPFWFAMVIIFPNILCLCLCSTSVLQSKV